MLIKNIFIYICINIKTNIMKHDITKMTNSQLTGEIINSANFIIFAQNELELRELKKEQRLPF